MNKVNKLIDKTRKYLTRYDYDMVIECCDKILKLDSKSQYGLRFNGVAYSQKGDYKKALEYYQRLYELSPDDNTKYEIAYLYEKLGCYEKALDYYDKKSGKTWIMLKRRHLLTKLGSMKHIIDDYDELLMKLNQPDNAMDAMKRMVILEEKAVFQYRNKDYINSRKTLEEVSALYERFKSELSPYYKNKLNPWYSRLRHYLEKHEDSVEFLRKFFTYDDICHVILNTKVYIVTTPIVYAEILLELNPDNLDLLIESAKAYKSFDYSYSIDCLNRILELEPENTWAINEILNVYSHQYSKDKSLRLINQKLYIEDIKSDLLYRKIKLLESMTLYSEALNVYDEYLISVDERTYNKLTENDRLRCMEQLALDYYMEDNLEESYSILKEVAYIFKNITKSDENSLHESHLNDWYKQVLMESIRKSEDNPEKFFEEYYNINNETEKLWIRKINNLNSSNILGNPLDYCNILLNKNKNNIDLLMTKAYMYYSNKQLEKSLEIYNKIIKLDDNNEAKNYKFNILIQQNQYTKAYNLLTQMNIEYHIVNRYIYTLAQKLQEKRKYTESLQVYQRIFREIHLIDTINNIKYLLIKTGNTQKLHNCKYYKNWINLINHKYESDTLCPNCQNKLTPIIYGYPSSELMKDANKEEIILGGCCVSYDDPTHYCKSCKKDIYMGTFQIDINREDIELASYTTANIYWITRYIEQHPDNTIEEIEKEAYKKGINKDELNKFIEKLEEIKHIRRENDNLKLVEYKNKMT